METMVSSSSPGADIAAWGGERIVKWQVAALAALVVASGFAAEAPASWVEALLRGGFAVLVIMQLRLWDDLADRAHDRRAHPARVLARRGGSDAPFIALVIALGLAAAAMLAPLAEAQGRLAAYAGLLAALALIYGIRWTERRRAARDLLVLLKYPAIVLLSVATPGNPRAWLCAAAAFALVAFYDRITTPREIARAPGASRAVPDPGMFEAVACYGCGSRRASPFVTGEDDLTGKPGRFTFVTCDECGLAFQNPRLKMEHIGAYYDDEYIAHRKRTDWGPLTPLYTWTMDKHDRDKAALVSRYVKLGARSRVLDVGCGAGTFVAKVRKLFGAHAAAVDFKDLSGSPWMKEVDFRCGLFYEQRFGAERFDLVTMWHFLEHDYDPPRTLATARELLAPEGRLVIEVPRLDSLTWTLYRERWPGLQAPQHTVLFDRAALESMVRAAGLEIVEFLPYGAFPPYFYVFAGAAFKLLKGRGLDLRRAILPYFLGQFLLLPVLVFQRHLNLAMQTVVCRRARPRP
jgi:SAM-dependent methyltransferase